MEKNRIIMVLFFVWFVSGLFLSGCATTVAAVDAVGSTVVYAGKTVVKAADAVTPNIINKDKK